MKKAKIYYARMDEFWTKEEKLKYLENLNWYDVDWQPITPDKNNNWLTDGLEDDFDKFIEIGNQNAKAAVNKNQEVVFKLFSLGVSTNRDFWVLNYDLKVVEKNIENIIENYNEQVTKLKKHINSGINIDDFIIYDDSKTSWSSTLKNHLKRGTSNKSDGILQYLYVQMSS